MKYLWISIPFVILCVSTAVANDTMQMKQTTVQCDPKESWLEPVDGYLRFGYQRDGEGASDVALGGKLHVQTTAWNGLLAGASVYTSQAVGNHDGAGFYFFDINHESYTLLGEVYLEGHYGKTMIKLGRQEIDTPYADTDDIGMVPNTFEAYLVRNEDLDGLAVTAGVIRKMAGVDAALPGQFSRIDMSEGMPTFGMEYEGIEDLALSAWYYDVRDNAGRRGFSYFDVTYGGTWAKFSYEIAAQYSIQEAFKADSAGDAHIYGISGVVGLGATGVSLGAAYNHNSGTAASDGFGGGPFFTSAENLTLPSGGEDAKATFFTLEWDMDQTFIKGVNLAMGYFTLTSKEKMLLQS